VVVLKFDVYCVVGMEISSAPIILYCVWACWQINLDSKTREETAVKMSSPDRLTFEIAQKRIQALMAKDSYPRFLRSEFYRRQLTQFKLSPTLATTH